MEVDAGRSSHKGSTSSRSFESEDRHRPGVGANRRSRSRSRSRSKDKERARGSWDREREQDERRRDVGTRSMAPPYYSDEWRSPLFGRASSWRSGANFDSNLRGGIGNHALDVNGHDLYLQSERNRTSRGNEQERGRRISDNQYSPPRRRTSQSPDMWGHDRFQDQDRSPSPRQGLMSLRFLRKLQGQSSGKDETASTVASIDVHPPSSIGHESGVETGGEEIQSVFFPSNPPSPSHSLISEGPIMYSEAQLSPRSLVSS